MPKYTDWGPREQTIRRWLMHAEPGSKTIYHKGLLCEERLLSDDLDRTARLLYAAYITGAVILVQRRGPKELEYIAVKRGAYQGGEL